MVIAFSGQIASGKSTLSRALAELTGWTRFSFGEYVGECAKRIGLDPSDRETLQDLGACLAKHPDLFVRGFLAWTGMPTNLIIDGIRHVSVLDALNQQSNLQGVRLAFVDTPAAVSADRFKGDLQQVRSHRVEADIEELKPLAEWVLPDSTPEALQVIISAL